MDNEHFVDECGQTNHDISGCPECGALVLVQCSFDRVRDLHEDGRIPDEAAIAYEHLWSFTAAGVDAPKWWRLRPPNPNVLRWVSSMRAASPVAIPEAF